MGVVKRILDEVDIFYLRLSGRTYREISDLAGVSRQRVQQILRPPDYIRDTVIRESKGECAVCGIPTKHGNIHHKNNVSDAYNDVKNLQWLCVPCHRSAHINRNLGYSGQICPVCSGTHIWRYGVIEQNSGKLYRYRFLCVTCAHVFNSAVHDA